MTGNMVDRHYTLALEQLRLTQHRPIANWALEKVRVYREQITMLTEHLTAAKARLGVIEEEWQAELKRREAAWERRLDVAERAVRDQALVIERLRVRLAERASTP